MNNRYKKLRPVIAAALRITLILILLIISLGASLQPVEADVPVTLLGAAAEYANWLYKAEGEGGLYGKYNDYHEKTLFYISVKGGEGVEAGASIFFDLDDYFTGLHKGEAGYAPITGEGASDEEWVTVWVDGVVSLLSFSLSPVEVGIVNLDMQGSENDPLKSFTLTGPEECGVGLRIETISYSDSNGFEWGNGLTMTCIGYSVSVATYSHNLARFEVRRTVLDGIFADALSTAYNDVIPEGQFNGTALGGLGQIVFDNLVEIIQGVVGRRDNGEAVAGLFRPFTSTDDNVERVPVEAAFTSILGGIDIDGDYIGDNAFPYYQGISSITEGYGFSVGFETTGSNVASYVIQVEGQPEDQGWRIRAHDYDSTPYILDNTYEFPDAQNLTTHSTKWTASPTEDAVDEISLTFVLWGETSQGIFTKLHEMEVAFTKTGYGSSDAPVINHPAVSPVEAVADEALTITAEIIDNQEVEAYLGYSRFGDFSSTNKVIKMTNIGGDTYQAIIPASDMHGEDLAYYISAHDRSVSVHTHFIAVTILDATEFINGRVSPISGTTDETYNFNVDYSDALNRGLTNPVVHIYTDSYLKTLTLTADGSNYDTGVTYNVSTDELPAGAHSYYFTALLNGNTIRYPETGSLSLPVDIVTYTVTGTVRDNSSNPIEGVTVSSGDKTALTNGSGQYTLSGLLEGEQILIVSKDGYIFTPNEQIINVPPNQTRNFTGMTNKDPNTFPLYPSADVTLLETDPNSNLNSSCLKAGLEYYGGYKHVVGLLKFDGLLATPGLQNATVYDVDLDLYISSVPNDTRLRLWQVASATGYWTEASTYNSFDYESWGWNGLHPAMLGSINFNVAISDTGDIIQISGSQLKAAIQSVIDGQDPNYGFLIDNYYTNIDSDPCFGSSESTHPPVMTVKVLSGTPDLSVKNINPDPAPDTNNIFYVGQMIRINYDIFNHGPGGADTSEAALYFANDSSNFTKFLGTENTGQILAGDTDEEYFDYILQEGDIGTHYIAVVADTNQELSEAVEDNNVMLYGPFSVQRQNEGPTFSTIPNLNLPENDYRNNVIDLWTFVSDDLTADDEIIFELIDSGDPKAGVSIDQNRYIDIFPENNWFGSTTIKVQAVDSHGLTVSTAFEVVITAVNDTPVITSKIPDKNGVVGQTIVVFLSEFESDIESADTDLDWFVTDLDQASVTGEYSDDDKLIFSAPEGYSGEDQVTLHLIDAGGAEATQSVKLTWQSTTSTKNIELSEGWNFFSLSSQPSNGLSAEDICSQVGENAEQIVRWYAGGWNSHICGIPINDFAVEVNASYFIRMTSSGNFEYSGEDVDNITLDLQIGWNSISVIAGTGFTAQSLLIEISSQGGSCSQVVRWNSGNWDSFLAIVPINNFVIESDNGYFVNCENSSSIVISK